MWVLRESIRLLQRVFVGVVLAVVAAEILTLLSSGDWAHELQICLIVVGGFVIALGAMGGNSMYQRDADFWTRRGVRALSGLLPPVTPSEPQLAPGAVLFLSGALTIVLGFVV
jgi:heme O synthase-like polyprenyltransferase